MKIEEFLKHCPACNYTSNYNDFDHSCDNGNNYFIKNRIINGTLFSFPIYKEEYIEHFVILLTNSKNIKIKTYNYNVSPESITDMYFDFEEANINNFNDLIIYCNKILKNLIFM